MGGWVEVRMCVCSGAWQKVGPCTSPGTERCVDSVSATAERDELHLVRSLLQAGLGSVPARGRCCNPPARPTA